MSVRHPFRRPKPPRPLTKHEINEQLKPFQDVAELRVASWDQVDSIESVVLDVENAGEQRPEYIKKIAEAAVALAKFADSLPDNYLDRLPIESEFSHNDNPNVQLLIMPDGSHVLRWHANDKNSGKSADLACFFPEDLTKEKIDASL